MPRPSFVEPPVKTPPVPPTVDRAATPDNKTPGTSAAENGSPSTTPSTDSPTTKTTTKTNDTVPRAAGTQSNGTNTGANTGSTEPRQTTVGDDNSGSNKNSLPNERPAGGSVADAAESAESRAESARGGLAVSSGTSERLAVIAGEVGEIRAPDANEVERAAAATWQLSRLIVGRRDASLPADARIVSSLAEAMRVAANAPEIQAIELRFSGEQLEPPFDVPARPLRVYAADGFKPIIRFCPVPAGAPFRRQMIHVPEAELEWHNVHFLFELPREVYADWSLFHLDRTVGLEFHSCSLTIRNADQDGTLLQDRVAFVELQIPPAPEPNAKTEAATMMVRSPHPRIELRGCVARGQATLVRSEVGVPFRLTWDQGLFVSTERLIESGGARQQPTLGDAIEIDLRHVTAFVRKGIYATKLDAVGGFPLEFVSECNNSIVLTDSTSPLIEQHGTPAQPFRKRPIVRGAKNFYPNTSVILLSDPIGSAADVEQFTFNQRDQLSDERKWYEERPEPGMVMWKTVPQVTRSVDRHGKDDYQLDDDPSNGMMREVGFDPTQLPELPAVLDSLSIPPAAPAGLPHPNPED